MEEWKWVNGFEGIYQISNYGRLKSFKGNKYGTVLSNKNKNGDYFSVILKCGVKKRCCRIHELVMESFVGERPLNYHVHHKDGNKQNNSLNNLMYISIKEHYKKTISSKPNMLYGMINYNRNIKPKKILQYDLEGNFIARHINSKEASDNTGVCARNILQVANLDEYKPGKIRSQAGGYIWRFEEKGVIQCS